jgi:hypothetical protein
MRQLELQVLADHEADDGDRERDNADGAGPQAGDGLLIYNAKSMA